MQAEKLTRGDVVQISPDCETNGAFAGCMLVVTEAKKNLVMGYVQALGQNRELGGQAFIRLPWAEVELVGRATWVIYGGEDDEEGDGDAEH